MPSLTMPLLEVVAAVMEVATTELLEVRAKSAAMGAITALALVVVLEALVLHHLEALVVAVLVAVPMVMAKLPVMLVLAAMAWSGMLRMGVVVVQEVEETVVTSPA